MTVPLSHYIDQLTQYPRQLVTYNGQKVLYVNGVDWTRAYDQSCAEATVTVAAYPTLITTDNIHQITISQGYSETVAKVFTGYVDDVVIGEFPGTWDIKCRNVLSKAVDTFLDDQGVEYEHTQAETAVTDLLSRAGLSVDAGVTDFTIGDINAAKFKMMDVDYDPAIFLRSLPRFPIHRLPLCIPAEKRKMSFHHKNILCNLYPLFP